MSPDVRMVLRGHRDGVVTAAISPDGSFVVTASHDSTLRVWDAQTGDCCGTLQVASI